VQNLNITIPKGKKLKIGFENEQVSKPSYIMVGSGYITHKGTQSMDYTKELLAMTPQEGFVFNLLIDNRDVPNEAKPYIKSNYSYIDNSKLTKSEKKKVYEGYKRLKSKDLVIRIKRGHYLINPKLVISNDSFWEKEMLDYAKLKENK